MKGKIFISLFGGTMFGSATVLILLFITPEIAWPVGLLTMAFFSVSLHVVLSVSEARMNKRFAEIERVLPALVLYQTVAHFNQGKDAIAGKVYLCQDAIVFALLDRKPYTLQMISADQLWRYELIEYVLHLYTNDGREYHLMLPDATEFICKIKELYWKA